MRYREGFATFKQLLRGPCGISKHLQHRLQICPHFSTACPPCFGHREDVAALKRLLQQVFAELSDLSPPVVRHIPVF